MKTFARVVGWHLLGLVIVSTVVAGLMSSSSRDFKESIGVVMFLLSLPVAAIDVIVGIAIACRINADRSLLVSFFLTAVVIVLLSFATCLSTVNLNLH